MFAINQTVPHALGIFEAARRTVWAGNRERGARGDYDGDGVLH
jgi:hypothetical protein